MGQQNVGRGLTGAPRPQPDLFIEQIRPGTYVVSDAGVDEHYIVTFAGDLARCQCRDHQIRKRRCAHIRHVDEYRREPKGTWVPTLMRPCDGETLQPDDDRPRWQP